MYETFFGFHSNPFNLTPDSDFFFASQKHEEALSRLLVAINERNGFAVVTGDIGSGKTTVCRALLKRLDPTTKVALVLNTYLSRKELLTTILEDLGIEYKSRSKTHLMCALNKYLITQATRENNVVLIVDEAQNLTPSVLEEIRMLSNLETEKEKLIQIILIGQPELRKKLGNPKLEQFSQRIVMYYHLKPLSFSETIEYILHRTHAAGYEKNDLFTDEAMEEIFMYSNGVPRLINLACHSILIGCFLEETHKMKGRIVRDSIDEIMHNKGYQSVRPIDKIISKQARGDEKETSLPTFSPIYVSPL
ncbi:ExeA family protein [Candidatus Omnitrophota bacterium]